jgi:hypothetical protein
MRHAKTLWIAVISAALVHSAFASLSGTGGPALPVSPKRFVTAQQWGDLVHRALDGDAASATQIGETYALGTAGAQDLP